MKTIYLSVSVMAILAGFLGFVLSLANKKLKVEEDPRVKRIEELLPGINCGACGYANCKEFAKKLVKNEETIEKCKITARNEELAKKINEEIKK